MSPNAQFLDGHSAVLHAAEITVAAPEITIALDGDTLHWPLDRLREVPDQADSAELILAQADDPVARLITRDAALIQAIRASSPHLKKRPPARGRRRLAAWGAAAVASVAAIIFVLVPLMANQLAEILPPEGERALGDATFDQIRSALDDTGFGALRICESPDGLAALDKMQDRLTLFTDLPYPVTVHVLDHPMINAFALPGGYVVFFRGLIDAAETPEEVAAVFAHEIGHVVARDPTRIALRSAGSIGVLGLLLGDFAGGAVVLFLAERMIQATYTQEAEANADSFAHGTLAQADIKPSALATMFERLRARYGDEEGIVAHFMSHPALGDRIEAAREADAQLTAKSRSILNREEWRALQDICG